MACRPSPETSLGGSSNRGVRCGRARLISVVPWPLLLSPHPTRGAVGEKSRVSFLRIMNGLERDPAIGRQAEQVARIGFLTWACSVEGPVTAQVARAALDCPEAVAAESDAARAFVGILQEASRAYLAGTMRRRRARVQH